MYVPVRELLPQRTTGVPWNERLIDLGFVYSVRFRNTRGDSVGDFVQRLKDEGFETKDRWTYYFDNEDHTDWYVVFHGESQEDVLFLTLAFSE